MLKMLNIFHLLEQKKGNRKGNCEKYFFFVEQLFRRRESYIYSSNNNDNKFVKMKVFKFAVRLNLD